MKALRWDEVTKLAEANWVAQSITKITLYHRIPRNTLLISLFFFLFLFLLLLLLFILLLLLPLLSSICDAR